MQGITGKELSPRKAEYLKYIYTQGEIVKTTDIADHFSVAPSTVTKALSEITDAGYLEHSPYHGVSLTPTGTHYARFLFLSLIHIFTAARDTGRRLPRSP